MNDTAGIRDRLMVLWAQFDAGKLTHQEARAHIGFARSVLDTLKVEIAAAHLTANAQAIPPVAVSKKLAGQVISRRRIAA